jgi:prephenate dehydrogenase
VSTEKPRVSIVGLGLIGASLGLALRAAEIVSSVVGHDPDRKAIEQAKRLGAVDRTDWNLISACAKSDLVILATPLAAIQPTLEALGPHLKPGAVVMDTASLKGPVLAWAAESLPEGIHFVGGDPIVAVPPGAPRGTEAARADLFREGLFCLVPAPGADERAIQMVSNLVALLGAKPLFIDSTEHDGLLAGVEHLPALLSLALLEMATGQPTWRELRKMASTPFELATHLSATDPGAYGALAVANRDNLLRWIDTLAASLASIREALAESDVEALTRRFAEAAKERDLWLQERATGAWVEGEPPDMPERLGLMDLLFGSFLSRGGKRER